MDIDSPPVRMPHNIKPRLVRALKKNIDWFINSGVMIPQDGKWGVAERILNTVDNGSTEKIYSSFPAWTEFATYSIIEQRRADCNFETAFLFLLAADVFEDAKYYETAVNILDFLYKRSGLLNRYDKKYPLGVWNWSHIKWTETLWFDDNGWNCYLQLLIAEKYPVLEAGYEMRKWALLLADSLTEGFNTFFDLQPSSANVWQGALKLPHWGALVCIALARAWREQPKPEYIEIVDKYHEYLWRERDNFIVSEDAYVLIGASITAQLIDNPRYWRVAEYYADKLISKIDRETGNIPAEHKEAPRGTHLADMIYTVNWALLGLQTVSALTNNEKYRKAFKKVLGLVIKIQDDCPDKQYNGCWRGMYDIKAGKWGGGNCYEGGAGSIYTGWTNAPISWVLAFEILGETPLLNK
jgi:hypothetical protein